jgi:hypothetical protein
MEGASSHVGVLVQRFMMLWEFLGEDEDTPGAHQRRQISKGDDRATIFHNVIEDIDRCDDVK